MRFFGKFLWIAILFFEGLYANDSILLKHLKKAEGKGGNHSMRGIDFIYMINLDQRPEKFAQASEQLHRYGIYPYRFSAVNGWKLSLQDIQEIGLKFKPGMTPLMATAYPIEAEGMPSHEFMTEYGKTYFCHCLAKGTMGCALSHISVLKDAWDSGYETIWVMEDDIEVLMDPHLIPDLLEKLDELVGKENWDVLFTDQDYRKAAGEYLVAIGAAKRPDLDCSEKERQSEKYTLTYKISPDFRKIAARFGTHSMILRRSGIEKLLNYALEHLIFLPYDMDNYLAPQLMRYSFAYDVVSNMFNALSDNGAPLYENHE